MNFWKIVILFIATIDCKNHATSTIPQLLYSFSRLCHISVNLDCVINKDWRSIFLRNFRFNTYLPKKKIWCKKSLPWKSIFWLKKKECLKQKWSHFYLQSVWKFIHLKQWVIWILIILTNFRKDNEIIGPNVYGSKSIGQNV